MGRIVAQLHRLQTEVLVIGGGATGAGVARDLALRGFKTILVEKSDLTTGTTGRYHGLLHSGGRYVVRDAQAAKECIEENRILRRIMPFCIEDTGGFFALTPWDDPEYAARFVAGCATAGVPVEEITIAQMLREEPLLNPRISRCFRVPDASADSFLGTEANALSARQHGATILRYHPVVRLLMAGSGRVTGALCQDLVKGEDVQIEADLVVNAAGAWAGHIAGMAGAPVRIIPGKGTLLAINHRILHTVVNRCKFPADGDIIVPAHTVAVVGTTDVPVEDPDHFAIEPWEVDLLLEEGDRLVPGLRGMRILRAWAGVRPLYKETQVSDNRDVTRAFVLLDHTTRDGIDGLVTITSGKWTTYRKMAEVTVDLVCQKLGVQRPCRTHLEALPNPEGHASTRYHTLGARLAEIEKDEAFGDIVCECELVRLGDVERSITAGQAQTIDDVRRDVRVGMGPCQGGFCTYRVAGLLHKLVHPQVEETNSALRDFLQERWKGLLPILWGQQLRQERLVELIYLSVLNADHLPGPRASRLAPENYAPPALHQPQSIKADPATAPRPASQTGQQHRPPAGVLDVLVLGAGFAGLVTGWQAVARGRRTRVIAKGWGSLYWNAGCVDVLGYYPLDRDDPLESPAAGIDRLIQEQPRHPYALAIQAGGPEAIREALEAVQVLFAGAGYPLHGSLDRNWLLPTALGVARPTCLAPETMIAGDLRRPDPLLIVGFEQFLDFYPDLIAANLAAQGFSATGINLNLPVLEERRFVTGRTLANLFDRPEFRAEVVLALKKVLGGPALAPQARLGFPAVLGLDRPLAAMRDLEAQLGRPVFEIPCLPPSIPGIRLHRLLVAAVERLGGRVFEGLQAVSADAQAGRLTAVWTEAAARRKAQPAENFVLATGGLLGGGLQAAYTGELYELVAGLPVAAPCNRLAWLEREFLAPHGHAIFRAGLATDPSFRPLRLDGQVAYENLHATGAALAGAELLRERSLEGVAIVTGYWVGKRI